MHKHRCRFLGHRLRFAADGPVMRWWCERGCDDAAGEKRYASAEDARRYAAAFDRRTGAFGRARRR
jgi:hypothetical protein